MVFTTPNVLTLCRIATVPLIVYLLRFPGPLQAAIAAGVLFIATITDFLDGYIARSYGSGTTLGKFLDPLADKLIVLSTLIMLVGMPRTPRVPAWIVAVLVSREVLVTGLRAIAAAEGVIIAADQLGKYKMALQCIALQGLVVHYTYFHVDFFVAGMFMLWIAMVLSIWSGIEYFVEARAIFSPRRRAAPSKRAAAQ
jgi:CDP-diacylglycerol---glycerol-3-phosphate 3-phosphatidyltransferase